MKDLSEIRQDIDKIDREIVRLYETRMDLTTQVADYKIRSGKEVLDQTRELQKLKAVQDLAHSEFTRHGVRELFEHIMAMSRKKQYQLLTEYGKVFETGFRQMQEIRPEKTEVGVIRRDRYTLEHFLGREVTYQTFDTIEDLAVFLHRVPGSFGFFEVGTEKYFGNVIGVYNQIGENGLYIVKEYMEEQDEQERCLLVTADRIALEDADKVSFCFEAPDERGTLYHLLSHITYNNLNLNRIGSVVIATDPLDYRFFIDVSGNLKDASIQNAVRGLSNEARNFRILGNYR